MGGRGEWSGIGIANPETWEFVPKYPCGVKTSSTIKLSVSGGKMVVLHTLAEVVGTRSRLLWA